VTVGLLANSSCSFKDGVANVGRLLRFLLTSYCFPRSGSRSRPFFWSVQCVDNLVHNITTTILPLSASECVHADDVHPRCGKRMVHKPSHTSAGMYVHPRVVSSLWLRYANRAFSSRRRVREFDILRRSRLLKICLLRYHSRS
jgi:hypothetical protein